MAAEQKVKLGQSQTKLNQTKGGTLRRQQDTPQNDWIYENFKCSIQSKIEKRKYLLIQTNWWIIFIIRKNTESTIDSLILLI